jgi:hypothetical protein
LAALLANRRWLYSTAPFRHIIATDVFIPSFYEQIEVKFFEILTNGFHSAAGPRTFQRDMMGYDAAGLTFGPDVPRPMDVFFSRAWHDMMARLFDVQATGHMSGGLHHHQVGSANGRVHNDLNPGWFAADPLPGCVAMSDQDRCPYKTGHVRIAEDTARELIRAVAVIYYLANPPWAEGDGGATGLYRFGASPVEEPEKATPPISNSLLAFECTPYSFHTFLSNRRSPRNCLVMWLHREKIEAVRRWGAESIVYWTR